MERSMVTHAGLSARCLNPCFNGIQMELLFLYHYGRNYRLNPCFNGIQMEHGDRDAEHLHHLGLNPCFNGIQMEQLKAGRKLGTKLS